MNPAAAVMRVRLIPVTWTEARWVEALPGMPHGKHAQVLAAVPAGYQLGRDRRQWHRAALRAAEFASLRSDRRRNVRTIVDFLATARRFEHDVLRPGLSQLLVAAEGVSERTIYRVLDWLVQHRWIARVQRGSTERYRGVVDGRGNLAAEFVLVVPGYLKNGSPKRSTSWNRKSSLHPRARTTNNQPDLTHVDPRKTRNEPLRGRHINEPALAGNSHQERKNPASGRGDWARRQVPSSRRDRLLAVQALQRDLPDLRRVSDRALRSLLRPWYLAGWSNYDLIHALDHTPGGAQHRFGGEGFRVRYLPGWLRSRLALWTTTDGAGDAVPGDSPTARRLAQVTLERQAAADRRITPAPPTDGSARASAMAAIRGLLAGRREQYSHLAHPTPVLGRSPRAWRSSR